MEVLKVNTDRHTRFMKAGATQRPVEFPFLTDMAQGWQRAGLDRTLAWLFWLFVSLPNSWALPEARSRPKKYA